MDIIAIGLSHRTAPVEVRERLALSGPELSPVLAVLACEVEEGYGTLAEGAILSTCNRVELYAVAEGGAEGSEALVRFLSERRKVPRRDFEGYLYRYQGQEAVAHLFSIAAGVDSMVIGEEEILGQVRRAYELASTERALGPILSRLFRQAITVGKLVRTETAISRRAASISSVAVEVAGKALGDLSTCRALIIGAGQMAEKTLLHLVASGVGQILVSNRTKRKAEALAEEYGGRVIDFEHIPLALQEADIVISSTAAPQAIIHLPEVREAMRTRHNRPLFIIDIAVPRDVEAEVGRVTNVHLYDIDDLQEVVQANLEQRKGEIPKAEALIAEQTRDFLAWHRALDAVSTIVELRHYADRICQAELEKALHRLGPLDGPQREVVKALANGLVNKILHNPTVRLKEYAGARRGHQYAEALRELFGLDISQA